MITELNPERSRDHTAVAVGAVVLFTCAVLLVVILGAAFASWTHLQLALRTIEVNTPGERSFVPAVAATAIEVGLGAFSLAGVVLAFLRGERPWRARQDVWAIVAFAGVSFAANVYAGVFALTNGQPAHWRTIADVRGVAVLVFAGTLPGLIVLAIHVALDVVNAWRTWSGKRSQDLARVAEKAVSRVDRSRERAHVPLAAAGVATRRRAESKGAGAPTIDQSVDVASDKSTPDRIAAYVSDHGPAHWQAIARELGIGKTAVYVGAREAGVPVANGTIGSGATPTRGGRSN